MTIVEMHTWFRQYAQQMGMQNVRAILPEQIDLLINTSITDTINQILKENIGVTNDRVITDNSKVGQINALRTLYKVGFIDMAPVASNIEETRAFNFSSADRLTGRMTTNFTKIDNSELIPNYLFLVDFSLNYKKVTGRLGFTGKDSISSKGTYSVLTPEGCIQGSNTYLKSGIDIEKTISVECFNVVTENYETMTFKVSGDKLVCTEDSYTSYYLGVEGVYSTGEDSQYGGKHYQIVKEFTTNTNPVVYNPLVINTSSKAVDYIQPSFDADSIETNYFPVRIIDDAYLADTLNDFVLKNRLRSPIIVTYNNNTFDLYIDEFTKVTASNGSQRYVLANNLVPYKLRMSYIAKPDTVKYASDVGGTNVDCNLPEYMHVDILKHAVDLYRIAVSGSLHAQQQQEQTQQQENMRNNYRNEGNQNQ